MLKCPKCGKMLNDSAKFCGGCGTKIESAENKGNTCPICGEVLKNGAKFCGKCGAKIEISDTYSNVENSNIAGKDFSLLGQYIHWNILPGQLAVRIDENDIAAYGKVKGVNIQDGVKALFFVEGTLVAELESGSYSFVSLGAPETKKKEIIKEVPKEESKEQQQATKKGFFRNFINNIANHFRGNNRQRAENAGLTVRISSSVPPVNIVLVRTIDFPLMFTYDNIPTANLKTKIALHLLCKISNINEFYKNQLLDKKFVSFDNFSSSINSIIQGVLSYSFTGINCENISHNNEVANKVLDSLQAQMANIYPFIQLSQVISLTSENKEIENIQRMRDELYVSEQELVELTKRNDFLNRMANENNQQLLKEARNKVDFEAAMDKIDQDHELNVDEREKFALMLAAQKKIREAQNENDLQAALLEFKKSGMLRDEELDNLEHQITHNAKLRDLGDSQIIALATMQNERALDQEKLEWEIAIGNKRIENEINRTRMQDTYGDERRNVDATFEDQRRKANMDLDKEEQLNQLELLRQAQEIRQQREDAEHQREIENKRLEMEAEKQRLDSNLENQRLYQSMSAEQIMAANPNISEASANAMAEKFKAEAIANANNKTEDLLKTQNQQMVDFMSQQMNAVRDMSLAMSGTQNSLKDQMLDEKKEEISRVREDASKTQDRLINNVNVTTSSIVGALKGNVPMNNIKPQGNDEYVEKSTKSCPNCGALNDGNSLFCEGCGQSL